jgi:hypothetical protein
MDMRMKLLWGAYVVCFVGNLMVVASIPHTFACDEKYIYASCYHQNNTSISSVLFILLSSHLLLNLFFLGFAHYSMLGTPSDDWTYAMFVVLITTCLMMTLMPFSKEDVCLVEQKSVCHGVRFYMLCGIVLVGTVAQSKVIGWLVKHLYKTILNKEN